MKALEIARTRDAGSTLQLCQQMDCVRSFQVAQRTTRLQKNLANPAYVLLRFLHYSIRR